MKTCKSWKSPTGSIIGERAYCTLPKDHDPPHSYNGATRPAPIVWFACPSCKKRLPTDVKQIHIPNCKRARLGI